MEEYANRKSSNDANPNNELEEFLNEHSASLIKKSDPCAALIKHSDRMKRVVFRKWCQRGRK
jgi:hypothetical protein